MASSTLSPLDMLDLPDAEQYVLRCLNRRPGLTVAEIATATKMPVEEVEPALRQMVERSQVVEQLTDGRRTFSVRFSRLRGGLRHVPANVLAILDEKPDTFLAEAPLTALLTPDERETLLDKSVARQLMPNEVVIWQGDRFKQMGLVRMGLLKQSRLQKGQAGQATEYLRRADWFGLGETLSEYPALDTYTAVTESEILVWPVEEFTNFLRQSSRLSLALNRLLSQQLHQCQNQRVHGAGRLWVVEAVEAQAGATTFAVNLALLVSRNGGSNGQRNRVVLCNLHDDGQAMLRMLGMDTRAAAAALPGQNTYLEHPGGLQILLKAAQPNYPPQAQLDIFLTELQSRFDTIICDSGCRTDDEMILRLRGQAERLITLTRQADGVENGRARWSQLQPYARPAQKRLLAYNRSQSNGVVPDAAFHLILPYDPDSSALAAAAGQPIIEAAAGRPLAQAFHETYRRLSLNHTVAVFVPSTLDVDQSVSNEAQVQAALSFFGSLFGGATSSDAEGVWQSEDSGLVVERVTIVRTFVSKKALDQHLDDVIKFATGLKKEMKQEAVALDVDNQLILV
ncbi:MAG: Crp/Fnr family transcriptional regulator [Chloroflexota bacterium]